MEVEKLSSIPSLQEIVTKPGLLMGMLKGVINLLKTRFPMALGGANLAISLGLCGGYPDFFLPLVLGGIGLMEVL